jgi:hypothetical protein
MNKEDFLNKIKEEFSKTGLCYYDDDKIELRDNGSWTEILIKFDLPHNSFVNLMKFCQLNEYSIEYQHYYNEVHINVYKLEELNEVKSVPEEVIVGYRRSVK